MITPHAIPSLETAARHGLWALEALQHDCQRHGIPFPYSPTVVALRLALEPPPPPAVDLAAEIAASEEEDRP